MKKDQTSESESGGGDELIKSNVILNKELMANVSLTNKKVTENKDSLVVLKPSRRTT